MRRNHCSAADIVLESICCQKFTRFILMQAPTFFSLVRTIFKTPKGLKSRIESNSSIQSMLPDNLVQSVLPIPDAIAVDVHSMISFENIGVTINDVAG